jgi:hypothetical protein
VDQVLLFQLNLMYNVELNVLRLPKVQQNGLKTLTVFYHLYVPLTMALWKLPVYLEHNTFWSVFCFPVFMKILKALWILVYAAPMLALYLSPLAIKSPCICTADELPAKPLLLAHKGAAAVSLSRGIGRQ